MTDPDDLRTALADAREAAAYAAFILAETDFVGDAVDAVERACALLAAVEAMLPPAVKEKAFKAPRPAPVAGTLYARRVG